MGSARRTGRRRPLQGAQPAWQRRDILWVLVILVLLVTGFCVAVARLQREIELHLDPEGVSGDNAHRP